MISIIAAVAKNGVIGKNNLMPWHLPEEFKMFRTLTLGKPVIIGRRTFESLPNLLDNRKLIVLSRNTNLSTGSDQITIAHSIQEALLAAYDYLGIELSHLAKVEAVASSEPSRTQKYGEGGAQLLTKKLAKPLDGEAAKESPALPGLLAASAKVRPEVIVAGGELVYQQFLPLADRLYISHIHDTYEGDAFFPGVRRSDWQTKAATHFNTFSFVTYHKRCPVEEPR